ncbi:MAG: A/G-specific adenine glycosylase [Spirochaetes bacterium]|nr:A/G-specific adenine glycosylase [Spirochaetota bacterium]
MLQQTQAQRVVPKFIVWMKRFPDAASLASATQAEVLALWSGLGYNRRALALHRAAAIVAALPGAVITPDEVFLRSLPGVGPYTSRAILAFAFDLPGVFLETNIRTVILKHYFPDREGVKDGELEEVAAFILDKASPRAWYNALMDYGAEIKRIEGNHSRRAASYARQAPFASSFRRVRGTMLKYLLEHGSTSLDEMRASLPFSMESLKKGAAALVSEGFAEYRDAQYGDSLLMLRK